MLGGAGDDRLTAGAGNDRLDGGSGDDVLSGGEGDDTFVFANGFGVDRFNDAAGNASFDFSAMTVSVTGTLNSRGIEVFQDEENRIRASRATVTAVILGQADDRLFVKEFAERAISVSDAGGNDQYRDHDGQRRFDEEPPARSRSRTPTECSTKSSSNRREPEIRSRSIRFSSPTAAKS